MSADWDHFNCLGSFNDRVKSQIFFINSKTTERRNLNVLAKYTRIQANCSRFSKTQGT